MKELLSHPQQQTGNELPNVNVVPASPEVQEYQENVRDIDVGWNKYETNLPKGIDVFANPDLDLPEQTDIRLGVLDELPEGEYVISRIIDDDGYPLEIKRVIPVIDSPMGKVVGTEAWGSDVKWPLQSGTEELMGSLGYIVVEVDGHQVIAAVPTPETIQKAAHDLGVEVHVFLDDRPYVDGRDYLDSFAKGEYPIGKYPHDVEDDHITAMVLGGKPLKDALSVASEDVLLTGDENAIKLAAGTIDKFTAQLRGIISDHTQLRGETYGRQQGRATLHEYGAKLRIPPEVVEEILATAQENARGFGMSVKELD